MTRHIARVAAVCALPGIVLAAISAWWFVTSLWGGGLWPPDSVTLSEAVVTRNTAEALRLIRSGENPNQPSRVRAGLLTSHDETMMPVEAAVGAQRADVLRMLLANGAVVDDRELAVLRCYEQTRQDAGVREMLDARANAAPPACAGVRLPIPQEHR